jgi:chemotaxis signal transduction protein
MPIETLRTGEELVSVRAGPWHVLVPMRHVERVLPAAMPAARPAPSAASPAIAVNGSLLPVVFARALLGADEVRLSGSDQMLLLFDGARRALLWVDAVEDVVEHVPAAARVDPASAAPGAFAVGWSGSVRTLAVLDVPGVLAAAA